MSFLRRRRQTTSLRERLAAIDTLINLLEERHLAGVRAFDGGIRRRLHSVERQVGMVLPRRAVRARNTVRLHGALLDWQETVLDALRPERLMYADVHDANWSDPTPQGW
jgi:hypothetical protein